MASFVCRLLLIFALCIFTARSQAPIYQTCQGPTLNNSRISSNINALLDILVTRVTTQDGFGAASYGTSTNEVYGLAQCRGDVGKMDCQSCIQDAKKNVRPGCPKNTDAKIWYDFCFLRYSTSDFSGQVDTSGIYYFNVEYVTDPGTFNQRLAGLMRRIRSEAVRPGSKGLGKGEVALSTFETLYGLVQCTRDLSSLSCAQCLAIAVSNFPNFCNDKKGCRVVYASCYVRYELYPFFFPLDPRADPAEFASLAKYSARVSKP